MCVCVCVCAPKRQGCICGLVDTSCGLASNRSHGVFSMGVRRQTWSGFVGMQTEEVNIGNEQMSLDPQVILSVVCTCTQNEEADLLPS